MVSSLLRDTVAIRINGTSRVRAQGVSHAVLETCFISDWDDVSWYLANKTKIASAIVAGIQQGFGLNYTPSTKPYMVKVTPETIPGKALNIRQWPSTNAPITGQIRETMSLTIIEEASGKGLETLGQAEVWRRMDQLRLYEQIKYV